MMPIVQALVVFVVGVFRSRIALQLEVLAHDRRRILHFNVTEHPTAEWTAQQLVKAFPWATAPHYLLRDRDAVYGQAFHRRVAGLGLLRVLTAPRSPWQNGVVERFNTHYRSKADSSNTPGLRGATTLSH
ncbi:MAG TPA: hypothetical protein VLM91_21050 [Candidatus Methylomirabilis sp.]|nr:hypothetical protein [Candidatus Methylomirabilis sp.]